MSDTVSGSGDAAEQALVRSWIEQFNAERYVGGPNTSPMVEPDELDVDDPPEGMEDAARHDVAVVAPFIRAQAIQDVVKALQERGPAGYGYVVDFIEREFAEVA